MLLVDGNLSFLLQVIKNLLFVGKVIYLISPESNVTHQEVVQEEEHTENENGEEEDEEEEKEAEEESEEEGKEVEEEEEEEDDDDDDDDKDDKPPSLLWLMKKLSLMAKREAAYAPKVPLKANNFSSCAHLRHSSVQAFGIIYCSSLPPTAFMCV